MVILQTAFRRRLLGTVVAAKAKAIISATMKNFRQLWDQD